MSVAINEEKQQFSSISPHYNKQSVSKAKQKQKQFPKSEFQFLLIHFAAKLQTIESLTICILVKQATMPTCALTSNGHYRTSASIITSTQSFFSPQFASNSMASSQQQISFWKKNNVAFLQANKNGSFLDIEVGVHGLQVKHLRISFCFPQSPHRKSGAAGPAFFLKSYSQQPSNTCNLPLGLLGGPGATVPVKAFVIYPLCCSAGRPMQRGKVPLELSALNRYLLCLSTRQKELSRKHKHTALWFFSLSYHRFPQKISYVFLLHLPHR